MPRISGHWIWSPPLSENQPENACSIIISVCNDNERQSSQHAPNHTGSPGAAKERVCARAEKGTSCEAIKYRADGLFVNSLRHRARLIFDGGESRSVWDNNNLAPYNKLAAAVAYALRKVTMNYPFFRWICAIVCVHVIIRSLWFPVRRELEQKMCVQQYCVHFLRAIPGSLRKFQTDR